LELVLDLINKGSGSPNMGFANSQLSSRGQDISLGRNGIPKNRPECAARIINKVTAGPQRRLVIQTELSLMN
jgi:hypothetical protein